MPKAKAKRNVIQFPSATPKVIGYCEPLKKMDLNKVLVVGIVEPIVIAASDGSLCIAEGADTDKIRWRIIPERIYQS